jgi:hypothetical protein
MTPPVGQVTVYALDPPIEVTALLSEERPNIESGYGGWEEVERPRRRPITTFKSSPGLRLSLPMLLDNWTQGTSIEWRIAQVEKLGQPVGGHGEPPQVRVSASGGAVPHTERTWVVADIAWGDALMNENGYRVRQQVTLTLLEYVEDHYLAERAVANRRRKKATASKKKRGAQAKRIVAKRKAKPRWARVQPKAATASDFGEGEDLLTIAARELGDAERWVEVAELNGLRDPRAIAPGQVIRLP